LVTWYGAVLPEFAARNDVRDSGGWLRFYAIDSSRQPQDSSSSYMELSRGSNPKIMKYHRVKCSGFHSGFYRNDGRLVLKCLVKCVSSSVWGGMTEIEPGGGE